MSVILAFLSEFQGSETSQTDKFAAFLLLAILIVRVDNPDRWISSFRTGVRYKSLFSEVLALAREDPS